jgi:predicted lipoprotein
VLARARLSHQSDDDHRNSSKWIPLLPNEVKNSLMSQSSSLPKAFFTKYPRLSRSVIAVVVILLVVVIGFAAGVRVAKVEKISTVNAQRKAAEFNPTDFVNSLWDSQIVPTILEKAVDISTLIDALKTDQLAAIAQYGNSESGAYNFMVKGQGKVLAVDTTSSNGSLSIDLPPYDGTPDLTIQTGPVIIGFSLRDAPGIIHFGSVQDQIQYGQVNRALNQRAAATAFSGVDPATLQGKIIQFYGTFTFDTINDIVVIPVKVEAVG